MSNEKAVDIQQGILKDATDPDLQNFKQEVAKIEAEEQMIGTMFGKKVGKQASTQQMKEREKKKEKLILDIQQHYNIDTNEAYDKYDELVDTPIDELTTTTEASQTQLQQIDEFLTNHKDITDQRANQKLADVLDGKSVKDNGIDYNKEIEAIMERNLKPEQQQEDILDILDRMAEKETPKPIASEPKTQPKQKTITKPESKPIIKQEIPQQTIDRLVEKYKTMVSADLKVRLGKRAKQISPLLNKLISSLAYQPKQLDIKQAY
jgi:hypothetical protein